MSEIDRIDIVDDGPLIAEGLERLDNSKDEELQIKQRLALCRCGASKKKPYCASSHKRLGFLNRVEKDNSEKPLNKDGKKEIKVVKNGPYEVRGCLLDIADPMSLSQDKPSNLCRCGASGNKPLCDGSHKAINFNDEKN